MRGSSPRRARRSTSRPRPRRCLQVINSSPGDLAPVFDAMLEKATRLCEAPFGQLAIYDGEVFRFVAAHGEEQFALNLRREPLLPSEGATWLRILGGEDVVHIPDARESDLYRSGHLRMREFVDDGGARSALWVALRKDRTLLGIITIYRQEVAAVLRQADRAACRTSRRRRSSRWRTRG